jgi:hypothetical protein
MLRNMSCPSRSQIRHKSPYRRHNCRGIVFALPAGKDVLAGLLETASPGELALTKPEDVQLTLRQRIDERAQTLQIPAAVLVTDRVERGDERCSDLLSIITVLAKSSSRVYLRDKVPNLNQIQPGRRVVLIVPEERTQK